MLMILLKSSFVIGLRSQNLSSQLIFDVVLLSSLNPKLLKIFTALKISLNLFVLALGRQDDGNVALRVRVGQEFAGTGH